MKIHLCSLHEYHIAPILAVQTHAIAEGDTPDFGFLPILVVGFAFFRSGSLAYIYECIVGVIALAVAIEVGREDGLSAKCVIVRCLGAFHRGRITAFEHHTLRDNPLIGVDVRSIVAFHEVEFHTGFSSCERCAKVLCSRSVFP